MTTIVCHSCDHANEPTRVFCQQCGARLERPATVAASVPAQPAPVLPKAAPSAPAKKSGSFISSLFGIVFFAAVLAIILLALRPPVGLPAPVVPDPALAQDLLERYAKAAAPSPFPHQFVATSEELNVLLATQIKAKPSGAVTNLMTGEMRPFVVLENRAFTLGMELPIAGQRVVLQSNLAVDNLTPGRISVKTLGGKVGSLPLPPLIAEKIMRWQNDLASAYGERLGQIAKATQVLVGTGNVEIIWPADH